MKKIINYLWLIVVIAALGWLGYASAVPTQYGTQQAGVGGTSGYPIGSTPINISATGTTTAITATLPADSPGLRTTYICGFFISSTATASSVANATITGLGSGGTLNFSQYTSAVATIAPTPVYAEFTPCLPASGPATAIVVTTGAPGSGGVISASAWGFQF